MELKAELVKSNAIDDFKNKWALVCARKKDGTFNMCTISWGSIGELWSKDVAIVYLKPIRYTDQFVDEDEYFTITFLDESHKKDLAICGSKSGRDIDKVKETNLKPIVLENGITFEDYEKVYICRKIYKGQFQKEKFINSDKIVEHYYKDEPFHNVYIGEIIKVMQK